MPTPSSPVLRTGSAEHLLSTLVERASILLEESARVVIGLTGATGSGKSTLAAQLEEVLAEQGLLAGSVPMDGFHMSNAVLDALGRHDQKGAPDTFDVDGYLALLDRVRSAGPGGEPAEVLAPVYRRDLHEPVAAGARVSGRGVVVTEGNYLATDTHGWQGARQRIDVLVMLDVPSEVVVERLMRRHQDFGRHSAEAAHWVRTVDLPHAGLVSACATRCDEVWEVAILPHRRR